MKFKFDPNKSPMTLPYIHRPEYFNSIVKHSWEWYEGPYEFNNDELGFIEELEKVIKRTDHVLDIGCGHGKWHDVLKKYIDSYHGVDYSKNMIELARKRNPTGKWTLCDESFLPEKHYDVIMEVQMLYVFPGHKRGFINKFMDYCDRVILCEPGGIEVYEKSNFDNG